MPNPLVQAGVVIICVDMLEKVKKHTCQFISFGISDSYSFETELSKNYGCHGFSADPTVR